jgi:DNA processing protein
LTETTAVTDAEFRAWFRLLETPGLGRDRARTLLMACGSPQAVFDMPPATLRQLVGAAVAQALGQIPPHFEQRLAAALQWRHGGSDRHVLCLGDPDYPPLLLATADPPLLLYVQGQLAWLNKPAVAIVGSRSASAQGLDNARAFARALGEQGWVVVSGLAQGIDGAAHEGALAASVTSVTSVTSATAGAGTVAVVGTGLDRVYPPSHRDLAQRIAQQGALVSEYAPGVAALPENFPQRNRIIAGLCQGTLVVEAALRSGSLITARMALEAGREVFAVPGSIHSPHAKGCHQLLKQGAKLVESASDITEELRGPTACAPAQTPLAELPETDDPLLAALGFEPTTLDALQARTGWPTAELNAKLLELELQARVARLPGGLFQRRGAA